MSKENIIDLKKTTKNVVPDDVFVDVKSNCFGKLIWKSKDGLKIMWESYGDTQEIQLKELREMKVTSPKFFTDNLVVLTGFTGGQHTDETVIADVYKTLGVSRFYNYQINLDGYDNLHKWTERQIKDRVSVLNKGAKENLAIAVIESISSGVLDSLKTIKAFEDALGCEFSHIE